MVRNAILPRAEESINLKSGYRQVELQVEKLADVNRFSLLLDENIQLTRDFDGGIPLNSFFIGVCSAYDTKQQSVNEPLEIIRNMLGPFTPVSPTGKPLAAGDGIMIWIEKR